MFQLTGKKCYLVPFEEAHLNTPDYINWLRDYEVVKTINRPDYILPVSFLKVKEYCYGVMKSSTDIFMAMYYKEDNTFIGTMRVSSINFLAGTADIGILIGNKNYWGRGIASDGIQLLCAFLFEKVMLRRLTSGLMAINPAMQKAFEKSGFKVEGIKRQQDFYEGQYVDHILMGCLRNEFISGY